MNFRKHISIIFYTLFFADVISAQQHRDLRHPPPEPEFSVLNFCYGDTTYFINQSLRLAAPNWFITHAHNTLIDTIYVSPNLDVDTNIAFKFPAIGTYTVTLTENNGHYVTLSKELVVDTITRADFLFQSCGKRFVSMSSCASSYKWNFGDGGISTDPLPMHQYADTGNYKVTLIASNGKSSDTLTKIIHVDALGYPNPSIIYTISNDTVYLHCSEVDDYYYWSFGDTLNTYCEKRDTMFFYPDTGTYQINLLVRNACSFSFAPPLDVHITHSGIKEQDSDKLKILIYPNPSPDQVVIEGENVTLKGAQVSLLNILGEELMHIKGESNHIRINLSSYENGIYFLRIGTKEGPVIKKIIVNKS